MSAHSGVTWGTATGRWHDGVMTILPIRITGDPVLHRRAEEVTDFDSSLVDLAHDMVETMTAAPGVGLAGPQVGVGARIFVWGYGGLAPFDRRYVDEGGAPAPGPGILTAAAVGRGVDLHEDGVGRRGIVVNPQLMVSPVPVRHPDATSESEGCLSFPGLQYPLERAEHAVLTGFDVAGAPIRVEAWGWLARIFQHEFDHLDGTLYVDRLADPWASQATEAAAAAGWGVPGNSWLPGRG